MGKGKQISYSQALSELEKIVVEIESDKIDVDALAEKVRRASQLVKFCRAKLRSAEDEVKKALGELGEKEETPTDSGEGDTEGA